MTLDDLIKISPDINWILYLNELTNIKIDYLMLIIQNSLKLCLICLKKYH